MFNSRLALRICASAAIFNLALIPAMVVAQTAPAASQVTPAQPATLASRLDAIEKALDAEREKLHIPGMSLVIVKDDRVIDSKGFGLKNVEQKLPVTPDTLFAIGSSSKAFTAMTAMMSVDDGKLSLTDSPKKYLPYFNMRDKDTDAKITISDLLCHRSGLARTDLAMITGKLSSEELIRVACAAKPTAKLGEKFQYQNLMFLTAGTIVGTVQDTNWQNVVTERIFRPLGMKATNVSYHGMLHAPDHALGYAYDEDTKSYTLLPLRNIDQVAPAGAINSNATDMAKWLRFLLNRGTVNGKRLISEKSFDDLFTPHMAIGGNINYGYGWFLRDWNGHKVAEHGGNIDGFNAEVALLPDQHLGFVLLTNVTASSLVSTAQEIVWKNLVDLPAPVAPTVAATQPTATAPDKPLTAADPNQEVGDYQAVGAPLVVHVTMKEGKLLITVPGQPSYPLENLGGRSYKLGAPVPSGYLISFRPAKNDPKLTEADYQQPGVKLIFQKIVAAPYAAPLSVAELMQKRVDAMGGAANLRKHHTLQTRSHLELLEQGLTADEVAYEQAPCLHKGVTELKALGKTIGTMRTYFDGTRGGVEATFNQPTPFTSEQVAVYHAAYDFYAPLDVQTNFKSVVITKKEAVHGEDAYVVEETPEKGEAVVEYISAKTFLPLKLVTQETLAADIHVPVTESFSDYRLVDGVQTPFHIEREDAAMGNVVVTVKEAKFDVDLPKQTFVIPKTILGPKAK